MGVGGGSCTPMCGTAVLKRMALSEDRYGFNRLTLSVCVRSGSEGNMLCSSLMDLSSFQFSGPADLQCIKLTTGDEVQYVFFFLYRYIHHLS